MYFKSATCILSFSLFVTNVSSWSIVENKNSRANNIIPYNTKGSAKSWNKRSTRLSAVIVEEETETTGKTDILTNPNINDNDALLVPSWKWRRENIRIRTTKFDDLDEISNILTIAASSTANNNNKYDFNQMISKLRIKSSFKTQLNHRLHAITHGKDAFNKILDTKNDIDQCDIDTKTMLINQYLAHVWHTNEKIRSSIELAVHSSSFEECYWKDDHPNFAVPPDDTAFLHHTMISIEDNNTDDIIGFCEIAILPMPSSTDNDGYDNKSEGEKVYGPIITNLVIKDTYRRKGIAKHVMKFVRKHVRLNYSQCFTTLGLYVHEHNLAAIKLYENEGFISCYDNNEKKNGLYFMQREL